MGGRWYMRVLVPRRSGLVLLMPPRSLAFAPSASAVSGVVGWWRGRRVDGPRMLRVPRGGVVQVRPTAVAMGVVVGGLACPLLLPQRPYSSSPSSGLRLSSIV